MDIISEQVFDQKLKSEEVVLVDFWAPWCGPCRMLTPTIDKLKEQYPNNILKVNVDQMQSLAARYGVRGIPNVTIIKNGEVQESMQGVQPGYLYEEKLKYYIS
jgi:thioredoxin 1|tara:strand:+ start:10545 stop:10853 length:309 start_codon:yes stop_codon:yes gene_type:complete